MVNLIANINNFKLLHKDGKLGIDTTNPLSIMHVAGDIRSDDSIYAENSLTVGYGTGTGNATFNGLVRATHLLVDGTSKLMGDLTIENDIKLNAVSKIFLDDSNGISGQVLTSGGSSGSLTWTTPSSGGTEILPFIPNIKSFNISQSAGDYASTDNTTYFSSFYTQSSSLYTRVRIYTTINTSSFSGTIGVCIFSDSNQAPSSRLAYGESSSQTNISGLNEIIVTISNFTSDVNTKYWLGISCDTTSGSLYLQKFAYAYTSGEFLREKSSFYTSGGSPPFNTTISNTVNSDVLYYFEIYNPDSAGSSDIITDITDLQTATSELSSSISVIEQSTNAFVTQLQTTETQTINTKIKLSSNAKIQIGTSFGSSGQVLTTGGDSDDPFWSTVITESNITALQTATGTLKGLIDTNISDISNLQTATSTLQTQIDNIDTSGSGGGSATFTDYSSGTIPTADASGNFVRADGNLTLPSATSGRYLTILPGPTFTDFAKIQTFKGTVATEWVGYSVCVSADGSVFAYGSFRAAINGNTSAGYVRIFRKNESGSYVAEQTIDGIYQSQQIGSYVDINGAGTRIVIHSRSSTSNANIPTDLKNGFADVYDYSNGTWTKTFTAKGSTFSTSTGNYQYGKCAISKDGNTIIVSNTNALVGTMTQAGYADIFFYNGSTWSQKGAALTGSAAHEQFGMDIDVNSDGTRIAIGASRYTSSNTGRVQVFTYNGTAWTQYGNDMASSVSETTEEFGRTVKFNENGTRIVISSPNKDTTNTDAGIIVVYEDQSGTWTQIGSALSGRDIADDHFGFYVDMTDDGNTILGGSREYNNFDSYTRFYSWNGTDWDTLQTIDAPAGEGGRSLVSVISRDGTHFVNGLAYWDGDTGTTAQAGKVELYKKDINMIGSKIITPASNEYINGSTNVLTVNTLTTFACSTDGEWIAEVAEVETDGLLDLTSTNSQTINGPITLEDDISLSTNSKIQLGTSYGTSGQVLTSGGSSGALTWTTPSSGGGGGGSSSITPYIFITKNNDQTITTSAGVFTDRLVFNTVDITSTGSGAITLDTSTGRITINETGIYKLDAMISADATGGNRVVAIAQLQKNGTYLAPYECYAYCRQSTNGENTASLTGILSLSSSDYLEIYIGRSTAEGVKIITKGTGISLMKIA